MLHRVTILLFTAILFLQNVSAQTFDHPFVEQQSGIMGAAEIESLTIKKNKTVVTIRATNTTPNNLSYSFYGTNDWRAMRIVDPVSGKIYKQRWQIGGNVTATTPYTFILGTTESRSINLYFDAIDDNVKSVDIIEGDGNQGFWTFKGIKLLTAEELTAWKTQYAAAIEAKQNEQQAAQSTQKAQEEAIAKEQREKRARENEAASQRANAEQLSNERNARSAAQALTKKNTVSSISYDGAYCATGKGYIFMRAAPMRYGKLGFYMGEHDKFHTWFLPQEPDYVIVPRQSVKFILAGEIAKEVSSYYISEVVDVHQTRRLVATDMNSGEVFNSMGHIVLYIAEIQDNLTFRVAEMNRRSISNSRAEVSLINPLPAGKPYMLWSEKTGKYFFFKIL